MKRIFDFILALCGLIIFCPVLVFLAVIVRVELGSPVFFAQWRPGLCGAPFKLYKFRTMIYAHDEAGKLLPDSTRLTKFGQFLRKTSLDELPSLINVLKLEISLVGPRPLLMEYLPLYNAEQARRHNVMPGITGWAQVNGRNALSWEDKFKLDVWYVDNQSFLLDLKILWLTVIKTFQREGINHPGQATMTRFLGYKK